jgi:hypothetical protein
MPKIEISIYVAIVCYSGSFAPSGLLAMAAVQPGTGRKVNIPPDDIRAPATGRPIFDRLAWSAAFPETRATSLGIRLGIIARITWKTDAT